jgi:hypothetical protein
MDAKSHRLLGKVICLGTQCTLAILIVSGNARILEKRGGEARTVREMVCRVRVVCECGPECLSEFIPSATPVDAFDSPSPSTATRILPCLRFPLLSVCLLVNRRPVVHRLTPRHRERGFERLTSRHLVIPRSQSVHPLSRGTSLTSTFLR